MIPVFAIASNIVSSLGLDTNTNWKAITAGQTGISRYEDAALSLQPFWASMLSPAHWQAIRSQTHGAGPVLTPFEQMAIFSARQALTSTDQEVDTRDTVLILSTTKGNIEWLGQMPDERTLLYTSAGIIAAELGLQHKPVVISHACVSGVVALQYGLRVLQAERYKHAIIIGCDKFSQFVLSGFQSFQAVAGEACKPFDAARTGINLGEAAATIVLSAQPAGEPLARLLSGATSNDANHISGPSRTGEELAMAVGSAMKEAGLSSSQIDMISAHGTATLYNDEMEAKAFSLTGLAQNNIHSLKGYLGHTLGTAGVLESAMILESIRHQQLIASAGYKDHGVSVPIQVTRAADTADIKYVLKTASGFGGCNAAMIWGRP